MRYGWRLVGNILVHYIDVQFEHNYKCPAVIYSNGAKWWVENDVSHRIDGPAIEYYDGSKEWYYQGKPIECKSQTEFERLIKLKLLW